MPAQLYRISEAAITDLSQTIASTLISAVDEEGRQVVVETIDPAFLRAIALAALTSAAGKPVLPSRLVIEVDADGQYPWLKRRYR